MPRLSLYRPNKSNDYKFFDRTIKEMFTAGATDLLIHKYLGPGDNGPSDDLTQPRITTPDPTKIQDLLFLENRDRKYAPDIYTIRGHYNVQNLDFDLSQFGLFLNNDIIFITVHYNQMIDLIGRKLMVGDVFELPHLTDYHPLNETIPVGLRRYYQITDANFASEGFTSTWYPHLWRIKCEPLVDSQEFSGILSQPTNKDNYVGEWSATAHYVPGYTVTYGDKTYMVKEDADLPVPLGTPCTDPDYWELQVGDTLKDIISRYNTNISINNAAIAEAARLLPKTGYDRTQLYLTPTNDAQGSQPLPPVSIQTNPAAPVPIRGQLVNFSSPNYRVASPVIRIGALARKQLFSLTEDDMVALAAFVNVNLQATTLSNEKTDSGSGIIEETPVLQIKATGVIDRPYGTADNTYSDAAQFPSIYLIAADTIPVNSTVIQVQQAIDPLNLDTYYDQLGVLDIGINASLSLTSGATTYYNSFAPNTTIVDYDATANTITLNNATIASIPVGATITLAATFTGEPIVENEMDYRADADPRFNYVKQFTPQGFGYQNGYLIGDGTAPNGLPTGAGITFPTQPNLGDYFLRTDYLPNILYRYDGNLWVRIGVNARALPGPASTQTLMGSFINNTDTVTLTDGTTIPQQQPLSSILKLKVD